MVCLLWCPFWLPGDSLSLDSFSRGWITHLSRMRIVLRSYDCLCWLEFGLEVLVGFPEFPLFFDLSWHVFGQLFHFLPFSALWLNPAYQWGYLGLGRSWSSASLLCMQKVWFLWHLQVELKMILLEIISKLLPVRDIGIHVWSIPRPPTGTNLQISEKPC